MLFCLQCFVLFFTIELWAHRPYINVVYGTKDAPISVTEPEISKAYYGKLNGQPEHYQIISERPFRLYLNILEAYNQDAQKNFRAEVFRDNQVIATLDEEKWVRFDEPWAGDQYWMGPIFEQEVPAGQYNIILSNSKNSGKYVFAVGTIDTFPPGEIVRTLLLLPRLKSEFFEKSVWTAYFNYSGLFAFLVLMLALILFVFGYKFVHRYL